MPSTSLYHFRPLPQGVLHELLCRIEAVSAGFYGRFIRLPNDRQQVMLAVLAKAARHLLSVKRLLSPGSLIDTDIVELRPVLAAMRRGHSRDLIEEHYGTCPDGFLGALGKTGKVQPVVYYDLLFSAFSDPDQREAAKVVRQLPELDLNRLLVVQTLDPIFLRPSFVLKVRNETEAQALNITLGLIRQVVGKAANDDALRQSIRDMGERTSIATWVSNWLRRAEHIEYPALELRDEWVPLDSGAKLTETGLRLELCVKTTPRIIGVLKGERFYYEFQKRGVIAEVQAIGPHRFLVLAGVYLAGNGIVPRVLRTEVERNFLAAGVPALDFWPEDCPWKNVERITREQSYLDDDGFGLDRLEHEYLADSDNEVAA